MVNVSISRCLLLAHRRTQSTADWVICDGGVKAPNRDILAHCVYPGWYSDTEQNKHTHTFFVEEERLTECRPSLLEGPFSERWIYVCVSSVCVCVRLSLVLIRTKHNQQRRAAGGIRVRGRRGWADAWTKSTVSHILLPPLNVSSFHLLIFVFAHCLFHANHTFFKIYRYTDLNSGF